MESKKPHSRSWTTQLIRREWTDAFVRSRLKQLYDWAYQQPTCYDHRWLNSVFDEADRIWYKGQLRMFLNATYHRVVIEWVDKHSENDVAGYVKEYDQRQSIVLRMNRGVFDMLSFNPSVSGRPRMAQDLEEEDVKHNHSKKTSGYHAGGLVCVSRLECFLHVMLHEMLHLFLTACDKLGYLSDHDHHGRRFHRLLWNWFRQTEHQHGLMEGFANHEDLADIRSKLKRGDHVEVMIDTVWLPAKVLSRGKTEARVSVDMTSTIGKWVPTETHIGLIRYPRD
jgi:hypothetical protein